MYKDELIILNLLYKKFIKVNDIVDSAPFHSTEQQPFPNQQPVTREYTITVPVAVNL